MTDRLSFVDWQRPVSADEFMTVMASRFSRQECVERLADRFSQSCVQGAYNAAHANLSKSKPLPALFINPSAKPRGFDCSPAAIDDAYAQLVAWRSGRSGGSAAP